MSNIKNAHLGGALLTAALIVACSESSSTGPTGQPALASPAAASAEGFSAGAAVGDIRNGPIEIERVEVTRDGRSSLVNINALPGAIVPVTPGTEVTLWVVWSANPAIGTVPRLIVDWGAGEIDSPDHIHCGPCLLKHMYRAPGRRTVTVTMDDRVGGVTRRTFAIDVVSEDSAAPVDPCVNYGGTLAQVNSHILVCNAAVNWGAWSDALVLGGWNVCNLRQWGAYAPAVTPGSFGLTALWIDGNSCAGDNGNPAHQEVWGAYAMNDTECYAGWKCCVYDSNLFPFAICKD